MFLVWILMLLFRILSRNSQNVLGHFQKDFEGGASTENLGAKFGGYGSFLSMYQISPVCSRPKSPPEVQNHVTKALTKTSFEVENLFLQMCDEKRMPGRDINIWRSMYFIYNLRDLVSGV